MALFLFFILQIHTFTLTFNHPNCTGILWTWLITFHTMFSACLEFCLRTQIRLGAHPTRPCGFEAVHRTLQPLAAHADVPEVLPGGACV